MAPLCLPSGRNFDEEGNMLDWWSNFSAQHFQEQAECMVHQYGNYSWDLAEQQNVSAWGAAVGMGLGVGTVQGSSTQPWPGKGRELPFHVLSLSR